MKLVTSSVVVCLFIAVPSSGQSLVDRQLPAADVAASSLLLPAPTDIAPPAAPQPLFRPQEGALLAPIGGDFVRFFSTDTAKVVGVFAAAALFAHPADRRSVDVMSANLSKGLARGGNFGGALVTQLAGGMATYVAGRASGNREVMAVGGEIVRAQLVSQAIVQATKFTVGRTRPDGSNTVSFPSGHSASAFATATVLQRHYGWKAGIPAYVLAASVSASRLASSKHYLTDVLVGAGIGIAAGRTVTIPVGQQKFSLGAAPTNGGAMVTFSKR